MNSSIGRITRFRCATPILTRGLRDEPRVSLLGSFTNAGVTLDSNLLRAQLLAGQALPERRPNGLRSGRDVRGRRDARGSRSVRSEGEADGLPLTCVLIHC